MSTIALRLPDVKCVAEGDQIMRELPPDGGRRLFRLQAGIFAPPPEPGAKASLCYRLKQTVLRLSGDWHDHRL